MTGRRIALACALLAALHTRSASAQARIAEGRVLRPSAGGRPQPAAGQWIVLHRVGSDRAAPLDSVRATSDGRFRFRYTPSGAEDALYFVSARHDGIAYFSPPLRASVVRGGDADVIVYDTTSGTTSLHLQGRHLVISAPRGSRREVAEVFEFENDGTRTVVARDSTTPIWGVQLPARAESASVAPGDISAGAVTFRNGRADLFAPVSPGVRQLVLMYRLPADAFPLTQPVTRNVSVLEVLLEEPRAAVEGAGLAEVAPAQIDGRPFRRFLAQNVPASAVVRVTAPQPARQSRGAVQVLAIVIALAMLGAIGVWSARRRAPSADSQEPRAESLVRELALLDARFERAGQNRLEYERQRAELKDRIGRELAAENTPA